MDLTIERLRIGAAPGAPSAEPLLEVDGCGPISTRPRYWQLAPVVAALEIEAPALRLTRTGRGPLRHRRSDRPASAPSPEPQPEQGPARFALHNLQLRGGAVHVDDQPTRPATARRADARAALPVDPALAGRDRGGAAAGLQRWMATPSTPGAGPAPSRRTAPRRRASHCRTNSIWRRGWATGRRRCRCGCWAGARHRAEDRLRRARRRAAGDAPERPGAGADAGLRRPRRPRAGWLERPRHRTARRAAAGAAPGLGRRHARRADARPGARCAGAAEPGPARWAEAPRTLCGTSRHPRRPRRLRRRGGSR